jgi:hypothetical protein
MYGDRKSLGTGAEDAPRFSRRVYGANLKKHTSADRSRRTATTAMHMRHIPDLRGPREMEPDFREVCGLETAPCKTALLDS